MLTELELEKWKIHLVLRNNGSNIVKALGYSKLDSFGCTAHSLQLVLHDAIFDRQSEKNTVQTSRTLITRFRHSLQAQADLNVLQGQLGVPQKKLVQDVPTRRSGSRPSSSSTSSVTTSTSVGGARVSGINVTDHSNAADAIGSTPSTTSRRKGLWDTFTAVQQQNAPSGGLTRLVLEWYFIEIEYI